MFDLNFNFTGIFNKSNNNLDLNAVNDYIDGIADPLEKINAIADYIYSSTKYSVFILTKNKNIVLRRNFDPYKVSIYNLTSIPILDKSERLLGTLALGNSKEIENADEFQGLIKILAGIIKLDLKI